MNSPKKESLSKAVLNVSTYKQLPGNEFAEVRQYTTIDITDLLREKDITSVFSVNGICTVGGPYLPGGNENEFNFELAVSEPEINLLRSEMCDIIDIAIVNDKQNKAIKHIIDDKFDKFISEHWEPIRECPEIKRHFDEKFEQEFVQE